MNAVDIVNFALTNLGIPTITDLNDPALQARQCNLFYPACRDRVLRDHHWSFAAGFADLATLDADSPDPAFPFVCQNPVDLLRIRYIDHHHPYRVFGAHILLDVFPARLFYTRRVTDANVFDPLFVEALQYLITSELALANSRDPAIASMFRQRYEERLAVARSIDSSENIHDFQRQPRRSSFIAARTGCRPLTHQPHAGFRNDPDAGIQE